MRGAGIFGVVLFALGCGEVRLGPVEPLLVIEAESLSFGTVPVGGREVRTVRVINAARAPAQATVRLSGPVEPGGGSGFACAPSLELPAGGSVALPVTFEPMREGRFSGELVLRVDGLGHRVALSGEARAGETCPAPGPCRAWTFDASARACTASTREDGAACEDPCLLDGSGVCAAGACSGQARTCDDGNACTADACGPEGCVHVPVECPGTDDPCLAPSCDPERGCGLTPVPDGTHCGRSGCGIADVCVAGACVARAVPEGAPCGLSSPCAGPGVCREGVCELPQGEVVKPLWRFDSGDGVGRTPYDVRMAMDGEGTSFLFGGPSVFAVDDKGALRWSTLLSGEEVCGEWGRATIVSVHEGAVLVGMSCGALVSLDRHDGTVQWTRDLRPVVAPLLTAGAYGTTGPREHQPLAVLPAAGGALRVLLEVGLGHRPSGNDPVDLFAIDVGGLDGSVRRAVRLGARLHAFSYTSSGQSFDMAPSVAVDEEGWTFLGRATSRTFPMGWELVAFDEALHERWRLPEVPGVHGVSGGVVLTAPGNLGPLLLVDARTGAVRAELPVASQSKRPFAIVASEDAVELAHESPGQTVEWTRWDLRTGEKIWSAPLGESTLVASAHRTRTGTLLAVRGGLYSDWVEISNDGQLELRCPGFFRTSPDSVLHEGMWIEWDTGPYSGHSLTAWPLPGRVPARDGWPYPSGSPARMWSAP